MGINLLLVDDHRIFRQALRLLLNQEQDLRVIGEVSDGRQALALLESLPVDVVLMDVELKGASGMEATRGLLRLRPGAKVIALSGHNDPRQVMEMLRAGASGYVLKDAAVTELVGAIRAVRAGETYLSPPLRGMTGTYEPPSPRRGDKPALSVREREVLQLMADGQSTKEIARTLHVSAKTIETHRRQLMHKLDLYSVAELTKHAIREGLSSLEGPGRPLGGE
jgi:DNA-binding NarL/FixJ family response regulator